MNETHETSGDYLRGHAEVIRCKYTTVLLYLIYLRQVEILIHFASNETTYWIDCALIALRSC